MRGMVRLHDYRCFRREAPATIEFCEGFTSFIGANNAGKSTLLKSLFELRNCLQTLASQLQYSEGAIQQISWNIPAPSHDPAEIICDRADPRCEVEIQISGELNVQPPAATRAVISFASDGTTFSARFFDDAGNSLSTNGRPAGHLKHGHTPISAAPLIEFLNCLSNIQYFGPYRNAINQGGGAHFDTHIGTAFIGQWQQWKNGQMKVHSRAIGAVSEDVRRLIGAQTLEINAAVELNTLQVVVNGRPHRLQELGAGFAQLVLVLGNALTKGPTYILIDEPELHLHPALQVDFVTTLGKYAKYGVMFTTHSVGLARLADRRFTVQKLGEQSVVRPFERTKNYAEFLGSLGIAGLQEIGWNSILLVEGTTDVRTAQQWLRLLGKDRKVVVLPLGGGSMIHGGIAHELSEVLRICPTVFALVDSERPSEGEPAKKEHRDFAALCADLKIPCCVTERRATENYFDQEVIDRTWKNGLYKQLGPFDPAPKDGSFWGKSENWKVAANMSPEQLQETDVGKFLSGL